MTLNVSSAEGSGKLESHYFTVLKRWQKQYSNLDSSTGHVKYMLVSLSVR